MAEEKDCGRFDVACKLKGQVSDAAEGAFAKVCEAFADAGAAVLSTVSKAFLTTSTIDLEDAGIERVFLITTAIGMVIALILLLGQVMRTAMTMRGEYMAHAVLGVFKAGIATSTVIAVTASLIAVADALSVAILNQTFGSAEAFSARFAEAIVFTGVTGTGGGPGVPIAMLLVFGLMAVLVGLVLFGEMVFRHAAIVILVASAPIGASGLVAGSTTGWWRKLVTAGIHLIFLKPVIVLCFAIGFGVAGESTDMLGMLSGLVTLALAAVAWPLLAKFFTWTAGHVGNSGGPGAFVGGLLGAGASAVGNRALSSQSGGSSFESDQATISRNSSAIDEGLGSGGGSSVIGGGLGGGAAGAGGGAAGAGGGAAGAAGAGGGAAGAAGAGGGAAGAGGGGAAAAGAATGGAGLAVAGGLKALGQVSRSAKDHAKGGLDSMAGHAGLGSDLWAPRPIGSDSPGRHGRPTSAEGGEPDTTDDEDSSSFETASGGQSVVSLTKTGEPGGVSFNKAGESADAPEAGDTEPVPTMPASPRSFVKAPTNDETNPTTGA